jgi:hypothetical protein
MKPHPVIRSQRREAGIALLIAIFVLLIIAGVAISMLVGSGTEVSLAGNYRSSTSVYYAGLAGLEEGRGRLLKSNPNYFNNTVAGFIPAGTLAIGQVRYILNPLPGEVVAPTNLGSTTSYPDKEYLNEFGVPVTSATTQTAPSVSTVAGIQGPLYKWVRITPATEQSLGIDVDNDGAANNNTIPLYYDAAHVDAGGHPKPSLIVSLVPPSTAYQVYQITALAVLPDRSEKLLQYVVTPTSYGLNFPSALTLAGNQANFNGANSNQYFVNGNDNSGNPPAVPGCTPNAPSVPAVGVTTAGNVNNVVNGSGGGWTGIPSNRDTHYTGGTPPLPTPSVTNVSGSLNSSLQSPSSLNQLVQSISQNANLVVSGNASQANMPANMSVNNPMTVVVDGNFSMIGNYTGYGLLVVTGNFSYSGTTGWKGVVLVIGDGTTTFLGSGGGNNEFDGAIYAATIKDANGNLLPSLGTVNFDISGGGGNGIYYNSCWIKQALAPPSYQVLSFREIPYSD